VSLQKNNIFLGDCLEVMKEIDDHSIDMILCDLPYGITFCKWDAPIDLDKLWLEYKRIIKKGGSIILTATMPFGARLIMSNIKWFRHELIWEKDNGSNPLQANKMPIRVHENILIFCEKGTIYNPQKIAGNPYNVFVRPRGFVNQRSGILRIPTINKGDRFPRSVLKFKRDYGKSIHTTQKPVALFEWLIKTYSNEGDLILDNCGGSGTTAIAAINTKRDYILIEKDECYYTKSKNRISTHQRQFDLGADE
jgi:site-specific DNA-methyltransferase (adenine-specific)